MVKRWFSFSVVLGLALAFLPQSQLAGQVKVPPKANNDCADTTAAYNNQVNACADYRQQLGDLRVRIDALRKQQAEDLERCKDLKPADRSACESLAELEAGQLSIQQQNYTTLAQTGCPAQTVGMAQVKSACASSANGTNKQTDQSKQDAPPAGASKSGKNPPVTVSKDQKQVPQRTDSTGHQPGAQQPRVSQSGQAQGGGGNLSNSGLGRTGAVGGGAPAPQSSGATAAPRPKQ